MTVHKQRRQYVPKNIKEALDTLTDVSKKVEEKKIEEEEEKREEIGKKIGGN